MKDCRTFPSRRGLASSASTSFVTMAMLSTLELWKTESKNQEVNQLSIRLGLFRFRIIDNTIAFNIHVPLLARVGCRVSQMPLLHTPRSYASSFLLNHKLLMFLICTPSKCSYFLLYLPLVLLSKSTCQHVVTPTFPFHVRTTSIFPVVYFSTPSLSLRFSLAFTSFSVIPHIHPIIIIRREFWLSIETRYLAEKN